METKNQKKKAVLIVIFMVALVMIAIGGMVIDIMSKKKTETNKENIFQNTVQDTKNNVTTFQNQIYNDVINQVKPEPIEPVDEVPANIIQTPTEEQNDYVTSVPTR